MRTSFLVFMLAAMQAPLIAQQPVDSAQQTPQQLQQLVAPIALYPDALVAQILTASTYPAEVVEADRWMQQHADLKGDDLGTAVDGQSWDPSVKALTQFPSVLTNMDKNISWTSSLGDAYVNQQSDVMAAIQVMRQNAQQAGNLVGLEYLASFTTALGSHGVWVSASASACTVVSAGVGTTGTPTGTTTMWPSIIGPTSRTARRSSTGAPSSIERHRNSIMMRHAVSRSHAACRVEGRGPAPSVALATAGRLVAFPHRDMPAPADTIKPIRR
jgi:hypothetical protein